MSDPFEAAYWNQSQFLLWIQTRDRWLIRWIALTKADHKSAADKAFLRGICLAYKLDIDYFLVSLENAQAEAIEKLSNGALRGRGRKNGRGPREKIPAEEWPGLQFYPDGRVCMDGEVRYSIFWTDVLFERDAVLDLWRDPNSPIVDAEARFLNHSRSRGRKPGQGSYADTDAPLVQKMRQMVMDDEAPSAWHAALTLVPQAAGFGRDESKAKRLLGRYSAQFSAEINLKR